MSLHGIKRLGKKDRAGWHCDKFLVHLREFTLVTKNVFQTHVLFPPKCNPNLFGHFFNPYIFLNLDKYDIPSSSCSSIDFFMHPSMINVVLMHLILFFSSSINVSSSLDSIPYPTFIILSFAFDFVFSLIFVNVCSAFDSIFCPTFVCVSCPYDC